MSFFGPMLVRRRDPRPRRERGSRTSAANRMLPTQRCRSLPTRSHFTSYALLPIRSDRTSGRARTASTSIVASIETTTPASFVPLELESIVFAVDGDVVRHSRLGAVAEAPPQLTDINRGPHKFRFSHADSPGVPQLFQFEDESAFTRRFLDNGPLSGAGGRLPRTANNPAAITATSDACESALPPLCLPFVSAGGPENPCRFSLHEIPDFAECAGTGRCWS